MTEVLAMGLGVRVAWPRAVCAALGCSAESVGVLKQGLVSLSDALRRLLWLDGPGPMPMRKGDSSFGMSKSSRRRLRGGVDASGGGISGVLGTRDISRVYNPIMFLR